MENYKYSETIWDLILPQGSAFCHWGGKEISRNLLKELKLIDRDKLCDICCGEAGTLGLIDKNLDIKVYGIDNSHLAIEKARNNLKNRLNFNFIIGDVLRMPFSDNYFNKIFAQDPDVFLSYEKDSVVYEISRVLDVKGVFVLQTYCVTDSYSSKDEINVEKTLKSLGYSNTEIAHKNYFFRALKNRGFEIEEEKDVHEIYREDNLRMIKNLEIKWNELKNKFPEQTENFRKLMCLEKDLFDKKALTGIVLKARKLF